MWGWWLVALWVAAAEPAWWLASERKICERLTAHRVHDLKLGLQRRLRRQRQPAVQLGVLLRAGGYRDHKHLGPMAARWVLL